MIEIEQLVRDHVTRELIRAFQEDVPHGSVNYNLFWNKVECRDGHWMWTAASLTGAGYPRWREGDVGRSGARVAWEQIVGPIPQDHYVNRTCGERRCVNPMHGQLRTIKETGSQSASQVAPGPGRPMKPKRGKVRSEQCKWRAWNRIKAEYR